MENKTTENHYIIDGEKYDRITTILSIIHSKGLENLRRAKGFRYVDDLFEDRAKHGKMVHRAIERHLLGELTDADIRIMQNGKPEVFAGLQAFIKWYGDTMEKVLITEGTFHDKTLKIAGTVDMVAIDKNGDICMVDFKTTSKVLPTHGLQLSAYKYLFDKANPDHKIKKRIVLQIRDGQAKAYQMNNHSKDFVAFSYAHGLYTMLGEF
jgi:hypothetical protein